MAYDYDIMKSELNNKQQEMGDLEGEVEELNKTIVKLQGRVKFQKRIMEQTKRNSSSRRENWMVHPIWLDLASQATPIRVEEGIGVVAPVGNRKPRDIAV